MGLICLSYLGLTQVSKSDIGEYGTTGSSQDGMKLSKGLFDHTSTRRFRLDHEKEKSAALLKSTVVTLQLAPKHIRPPCFATSASCSGRLRLRGGDNLNLMGAKHRKHFRQAAIMARTESEAFSDSCRVYT